jgi:hypothetical protein
MACLIQDGFDWFPAGQIDTVRKRLWGANQFFGHDNGGDLAADCVPGRFNSGKAFSLYGSVRGFSGVWSGYVVPHGAGPLSTGYYGMAVFVDPLLPSGARPLLGFFDAVNDAPQICFTFEQNGVIKVWQGEPDTSRLLCTSDANAFQENVWFHCEAKPVIANTGGGVEIRINTVPKVQLTGADTQFTAVAGFDSVMLGAWSTSPFVGIGSDHPVIFDDMFFYDTTGTAQNTWGGNLRVKTQFMIANGATDNFTIGGTSPQPTQWQSVLNQLLDDTSFVYSPTAGDIDLFTPDPTLNAPLVRCVQVRAAMRQDDATQRVGRALIRIGGTNYLGTTDFYTNQDNYTFYKERWQLSPATGVSFTGSEVNGLQAGVKVQA